MPIGVLIADDHPLMRSGIRTTLEGANDIVVVAEADEGREVLRLCARHRPDVVLLDLSMPGPPFVETIERLKAKLPEIGILALTAYDDAIYVRAVVAAGAEGYVLKDEVAEMLATAIRTVHRGGTWFSKAAFIKLQQPEGRIVADLTPREHQVLLLVARGLDNGAIAAE